MNICGVEKISVNLKENHGFAYNKSDEVKQILLDNMFVVDLNGGSKLCLNEMKAFTDLE